MGASVTMSWSCSSGPSVVELRMVYCVAMVVLSQAVLRRAILRKAIIADLNGQILAKDRWSPLPDMGQGERGGKKGYSSGVLGLSGPPMTLGKLPRSRSRTRTHRLPRTIEW